jgi:predicted DNA binding CopG/RHH family protein
MNKKQLDKYKLDGYEQDIEDNFEFLKQVKNIQKRKAELQLAAKEYLQKKQSITIRLSEPDLEAMRIKASKLGIPYQTYINMLIHKDAVSGW